MSFYIIVNNTNIDTLIEEVNQKVAEGFAPQGGVSQDQVTLNTPNPYFRQAMFRKSYPPSYR